MCCSILLSRQENAVCRVNCLIMINKGGIDHCDLLGGYFPYHPYSLSRAENGAGSVRSVTWVPILSCVYHFHSRDMCRAQDN